MKKGSTDHSENDGDEEFFDARDNWDESPRIIIKGDSPSKTTDIRKKEGLTSTEDDRPRDIGRYQTKIETKPQLTLSFQHKDKDCFSSLPAKSRSPTTQHNKISQSTASTDRTEGTKNRKLKYLSRPISTHNAPKILWKSPPPTPKKEMKIINRSSPLAVVNLEKTMKDEPDFPKLWLQQELRAGAHAIWVARFSFDEQHFATGGEDRVLRVWKVGDFCLQSAERLFDPTPREYKKHTRDILDISWSTRSAWLLLSAGLDKAIYLWDLKKLDGPLKTFEISEPATSVSFLPASDDFFCSGSLDMIVRLWRISDKAIVDSQKTSEVITSVGFSPDGAKLLTGLYNGQCIVYRLQNGRLSYTSVINVRNRYGTYSGGRKVTGIHFVNNSEALVTTADSRLRMVSLEDYVQIYKYKGHQNTEIQISASMSEDEDFVISGSEDGNVYIWNRYNKYVPFFNPAFTGYRSDHNGSVEFFKPFGSITVTNAQFAPLDSVRRVSRLFQACVPPAIVKHILIACSADGRIRVYYNYLELKQVSETRVQQAEIYILYIQP